MIPKEKKNRNCDNQYSIQNQIVYYYKQNLPKTRAINPPRDALESTLISRTNRKDKTEKPLSPTSNVVRIDKL